MPQKDTASAQELPEKAVFSSIPSCPQMVPPRYLSVLPHFGVPISKMGEDKVTSCSWEPCGEQGALR